MDVANSPGCSTRRLRRDQLLISRHMACRGYTKAFQVLQTAVEPDDAYLLGQDPRTGFRDVSKPTMPSVSRLLSAKLVSSSDLLGVSEVNV